jgi:DNA-binding phage protein
MEATVLPTETKMQVYMVQAIQGRYGNFMDFYVTARNEVAAVKAATKLAAANGFDVRWTRFVI